MATPVRFQATVAQIERFGPDVATYHLSYEGRRLRFRPGQFVHLALEDYDPSRQWPESRVFSLASGPGAEVLRLTISRQGAYTRRILDSVVVGQRVWIKGPYGEFIVSAQDPADRIVLVAGGTGITPFCSFMEDLLLHPAKHANPVALYYGARTADLLVYRELADRCVRSVPLFSVRYYVETGKGLSDGRTGRLDVGAILTEQTELRRCLFYLSGPAPMVTSFSAHLRDGNMVSEDRVIIDAWD